MYMCTYIVHDFCMHVFLHLHVQVCIVYPSICKYCQLRARRALLQYLQRCSVENQKGAIAVQSIYMAIAPFWFSTEHLWSAITPFRLSTDDIVKTKDIFVYLSIHPSICLPSPSNHDPFPVGRIFQSNEVIMCMFQKITLQYSDCRMSIFTHISLTTSYTQLHTLRPIQT